MKEIHVSKRNIILAVVISLGILVIQALPLHNGFQPAVSNPEDTLASKAATSALEAFFHVDYQENQGAWLVRVCALSTPSGCQFITAGADPLWSKFQAAKTKVTATVIPQERLAKTASEQVWKLSVSLSAPLPGSNKLQDTAYVAVTKTDDGWKFDRFLLEPEIQAIIARQSITTTPIKEGKK